MRAPSPLYGSPDWQASKPALLTKLQDSSCRAELQNRNPLVRVGKWVVDRWVIQGPAPSVPFVQCVLGNKPLPTLLPLTPLFRINLTSDTYAAIFISPLSFPNSCASSSLHP